MTVQRGIFRSMSAQVQITTLTSLRGRITHLRNAAYTIVRAHRLRRVVPPTPWLKLGPLETNAGIPSVHAYAHTVILHATQSYTCIGPWPLWEEHRNLDAHVYRHILACPSLHRFAHTPMSLLRSMLAKQQVPCAEVEARPQCIGHSRRSPAGDDPGIKRPG